MSLETHLMSIRRKYREGPDTGVFTDGGCVPNPGPGGWGYVHVEGGEILHQAHGHSPDTTNNRMELTALIEAFKVLPLDAELTVYSDSNLCVQTLNDWAPGWAARGWKRKTGPISNLELVKELYSLKCAHRGVKVEWLKAHNGWLWNEYADALSNAWQHDG